MKIVKKMKTERNAEMQGDETTPNSGGFLSSIIPHKFRFTYSNPQAKDLC